MITNCRVCNSVLFEKPLLRFEGMPGRAQHLPKFDPKGSLTKHRVDLEICQCSGCGLVQLNNEPVSYWREEITHAYMSKEMSEFRNTQFAWYINKYKKKPDFTSFNRLEHIPNPNGYLQSLDGAGIIEVPNFELVLKHNVFYEFIIDHLMYFTMNTFLYALIRNGFLVHDLKPIWHDYILSAVVDRRVQGDISALEHNRKRLRLMVNTEMAGFKRIVIYGASHQALTIIPMLSLEGRVAYVVDDVEAKQGCFTPAEGIPILPPAMLDKEPPEAILVLCGSFSFEVAERLSHNNVYALSTVHKYPTLVKVK